MKRRNLYFFPAAVEDAGGTTTMTPPSMSGWMAKLGNLSDEMKAIDAGAPSPAAAKSSAAAEPKEKKEEKTDVSPKPAVERPGDPKPVVVDDAGGGTAAKPAVEKPGAAAVEKPVVEPAAAAAAASKADDDPEKWPRNSADWDKFKKNRAEKETLLRKEVETHTTRVKELEAKLGEAETRLKEKPESDPEAAAEMERLKAENKSLTEALIVTEVTAHPKFKAHYAAKQTEVINEAKGIVSAERAPEIERILRLQDPEYRHLKFREFIGGEMDEYERTALIAVSRDWDKIEADRAREIQNANEHKDTLAGQNAAATKAKAAQFEQGKQKLMAETIAALQDPKTGMPIYQLKEGQPEWNAAVAKRIKSAEALLFANKLEPEKVFRAAFDAVAMPAVLEAYQADFAAWEADKAKLEAQVKALSKAEPKTGGGGAAVQSEPELPKDASPQERSKAWAQKMVGAMRDVQRS